MTGGAENIFTAITVQEFWCQHLRQMPVPFKYSIFVSVIFHLWDAIKLQIKHNVKTSMTGKILRRWILNYKSTMIQVGNGVRQSSSLIPWLRNKKIPRKYKEIQKHIIDCISAWTSLPVVGFWLDLGIDWRQKNTPAQQNPRCNQADGTLLRYCVWAMVFLLQILQSHDTNPVSLSRLRVS